MIRLSKDNEEEYGGGRSNMGLVFVTESGQSRIVLKSMGRGKEGVTCW